VEDGTAAEQGREDTAPWGAVGPAGWQTARTAGDAGAAEPRSRLAPTPRDCCYPAHLLVCGTDRGSSTLGGPAPPVGGLVGGTFLP